jgi:ABC-type transport system involved in multi-copper enzyme maturation permease subunit
VISRRFREVYRLELAHTLRRPLFWILIALLAAFAWGLSSGHAQIQSGDSDTGGAKAFLTSEFALARFVAVLVCLFYSFFLAVAAGMIVIRDDEQRVGELIHATPLTTREYAWGKLAAILTAFHVVLAIELALHALFFHALSGAEVAEQIGPFSAWNYARPALYLAVPQIVFMGGASFALGAWTRKPIPVFFLPSAILLASLFFVWGWSPSWLDPRVDYALGLVDPAGLRWLNSTYLDVDRGVEFYNHARIAFDPGFVASRVGFVALGLALAAAAERKLRRSLRGADAKPARRRRALEAEAPQASAAREVGDLAMRRRPPSFLRGLLDVTRAELVELRSQPGLYLFVPLIVIETIGNAMFDVGPFDTPMLATSGTIAAACMNPLTLLVSWLLLFYTVESLERERSRGLAGIYYASPVRTTSILFGKALANSAVGAAVVVATLFSALLVLAIQGRVGFEPAPFVLLWGLVLLPTFFFWSSFVTALYSLTRERFACYGLALAMQAFYAWRKYDGQVDWVEDWMLWSVVRWSDIGPLELDRGALVMNRALYATLGVALIAFAVRLFPRRDLDAARMLHRFRPRPLARALASFSPWLVAPLAIAGTLAFEVDGARDGDAAEKRAKDYWRKNIATWKDAPRPWIEAVVLDVEIDPEASRLRCDGSYVLVNDHAQPLRQIPVTPGFHYEDPEWTLDGEEVEPEDRAGLAVFTPRTPLAPGARTSLGFRYAARLPDAISEDGSGMSEFVLPSGAVLTSFGPAFVPTVGYLEQVGVDEDNQSDAKEYADDFYEGITESGFGNRASCTTRITIHVPEAYTANSIGVLESEAVEDGVRTAVWVSDYPVDFFNLVVGKWAVKRGDGTAIYYHPAHDYNVDEMLQALDGARRWYSEWFHPFPWRELKLSEFAAHANYAQGFATDITFSEGIGFLAKSDPRSRVAFVITAHEAAHQWWGNLLVPGKGPGGDILSEGMSHFSTILLTDQVRGARDRIEFCKRIETRYSENRQVDSERPLVKIDNSRAGDTTVTYDKGGWVFWMLLQHMGRENALAGLQEFLRAYHRNPDHPVLQDFVATMRPFAPDAEAYDAFVQQWFFDVVVPEFRLSEAKRERVEDSDSWRVSVRVENKGTGRVSVEVAAARGERFPEDAEEAAVEGEVQAAEPADAAQGYLDARAAVALGAGEAATVEILCPFEPERVLVDPDALVLQLEREHAIVRF